MPQCDIRGGKGWKGKIERQWRGPNLCPPACNQPLPLPTLLHPPTSNDCWTRRLHHQEFPSEVAPGWCRRVAGERVLDLPCRLCRDGEVKGDACLQPCFPFGVHRRLAFGLPSCPLCRAAHAQIDGRDRLNVREFTWEPSI